MKTKILLFLLILPYPAFAFTIALGGDTMLGRNVALANRDASVSEVWGNSQELFLKANFALVNAELAFTNHTKTYEKKAFYFKAPPSHVRFLKALGIDAVNLANNHVLDYGLAGLKDTLQTYKKAGITIAGAGLKHNEAYTVPLIKVQNHTIALISLTDNVVSWQAQDNKPGIAYAPINSSGLAQTIERIKKAKASGADYIIISLHWGGNWVKAPSAEFQHFAHGLVDAGADLIHGHSPHVFQGMELYKGKPIFYSLGDLIDDYEVKPDMRNDLGLIAEVRLNENMTFKKASLYPVNIINTKTRLAEENNLKTALDRAKMLSQALGTQGAIEQNQFVITAK
ncbi:CapA family protein [bacterium]|nr:CapA family protein [bacterium]